MVMPAGGQMHGPGALEGQRNVGVASGSVPRIMTSPPKIVPSSYQVVPPPAAPVTIVAPAPTPTPAPAPPKPPSAPAVDEKP